MTSLFKIIDLTHALSPEIPSWDGISPFELKSEEEQIILQTSCGTHIDAPSYFCKIGWSIDEIPLDRLFAPACVIDVSKKAKADYQISCADIEEYESHHGIISEKSVVVGFTGWSRHWTDPIAYRNVDKEGHARFPTFSFSAIELLVKRKIGGVAIDTLALESLGASFPAHTHLMESGGYVIENLANASKLPPRGAYILALPLKIEKGFEAPARVVGFVPNT